MSEEIRSEVEYAPLTAALIKTHVAAWIGDSVNPENSNLHATIVEVTDKGVRITIRNGKKRAISFQEIIGADKVILNCLASGKEPVWKDFRDPDPSIKTKPINNYSYAPPLAERIRRELAGDSAMKGVEAAEQQIAKEFAPAGIEDARERMFSSIVRRRGQPAFRKQLLVAYKGQCAITGCEVEAVLEAAHIVPYKGSETNHPGNGLLLRADLHTLFDLGLVAVDPTTMHLLVSTKLAGTPYDDYRGMRIMVPDDPESQPSRDALEQHRQESGLSH